MIPPWMKVMDEAADSTPSRRRKGSSAFVKKTLDGILAFFQEAMMNEGYAKRDGLLQGLDARAKLISILTLVFAVSISRDLAVLAVVYGLILLLAFMSRIEIAFFIKRVWLFVPLFAGVIVVPILFNVFLPGDPLIHIADLGDGATLGPFHLPEAIYITVQGAKTATLFTLRVATAVSAVVLLFLTTPQALLFKSLRSLGVPKVYVLTTSMAYRYIFLFMDMIRDLHIAKRSRSIKGLSVLDEQRWVGGRIGYMLVKSLDLSEKVHMAMVSRGFNGEVVILHDYHLRMRDYLATAAFLSLSLALTLISFDYIRI